MTIKSLIRTIPNYPKPGIMFRDITTLLQNPLGLRLTIDALAQRCLAAASPFDCVVGIEARGFILGGALAYTLGKGFVPVRKKGKLPGEVVTQEYQLEYGTDKIEIHKDAFAAGTRVLLVDDLLATGGTVLAAAALVEKLGGVVAEMVFIVDLPDLGGSKNLQQRGYRWSTLVEFEGE
ncbi:MAG: adenine phosphoribosyltransferase [Magnetococcales bacterium]|nr:adenine phosphoribosyltransferase [Magnetococcales bacterium]